MEIVATNVCKTIKGKDILKDINLHIKSGSIYGLIGPNGAGKSTFTRLLLNIYSLSSGTISVDKVNVDDSEFIKKKYKIGCVLDNLGLYKDLTAYENIEFFHRIYFPNTSSHNRKQDILSVLDLVDLTQKANEKITMFSKGQKQRLALARAFINKPKLLILDEPTVGLDVEGIFMVRNYIKSVNQNGTTVFVNSHNLTELEKVCDTYGFINEGNLIEQSDLNSLIKKYCPSESTYSNKVNLESIYRKIFKIEG